MAIRSSFKFQFRKGIWSIFALRWFFLLSCIYLFFFFLAAHDTILTTRLVKNVPQSETVNETRLNTKDVLHIVTAASSKEFEPLLRLIYSLTKNEISIALWLWSLDLSSCEISYIEGLNTPFKINIEQFPFHFYPLHIRQFHLVAIKPIVLEIASMAFGEAIWIDPNSALTGNLAPMIDNLSQTGLVIDSAERNAVGITYYKFQNFRKRWVECVKTAPCIKKYTGGSDHSKEDSVLRHFMSQDKISLRRFEGIFAQGTTREDFSTFRHNWRNSVSKKCIKDKICILTGNHHSHACLTPQLGKLRRNKVRYSIKYGYRYIEETFGFHKHGSCHPNWNKVQAILKHLPDCNMLMWLDSDCVFTNMDQTIESHFHKYPDKDMLMNWPTTDRMLNSGVILMKSTKVIRDFFHNITTGENWTENWCNGWKRDQGGIKDQVNAEYLKEKLVVEQNDHFLQSLCGFKNGKCLWKKNDYIAHFAPPNCPQLHDVIKDFFDKYPHFAN